MGSELKVTDKSNLGKSLLSEIVAPGGGSLATRVAWPVRDGGAGAELGDEGFDDDPPHAAKAKHKAMTIDLISPSSDKSAPSSRPLRLVDGDGQRLRV